MLVMHATEIRATSRSHECNAAGYGAVRIEPIQLVLNAGKPCLVGGVFPAHDGKEGLL